MSQSEQAENNNIRIVHIGPSNMSQAQSIFYNAYLGTDFTRAMLNDKKPGYKQRVRGFIRETLIQHYSKDNISLAMVQNDQILGAAMVLRANSGTNFTASWRWRFGMYSVAGVKITERLKCYYENVQKVLSGVETDWIALKALRPEHQKHGRGRFLLQALHGQCELDPAFKGISIDTARPELRKFFESEGYSKIGDAKANDTMAIDILFRPKEEA